MPKFPEQKKSIKSIVKRSGPSRTYKVLFKGTYRTRANDAPHPFECEFLMNDKHVAENPLAMFKQHGRDNMLRKYPDFTGFIKYWLESTVVVEIDVDGSVVEFPEEDIDNIRLMNRQQLIAHAEDEGMELILGLYKDDESLRTAIEECAKEPEAFYENQQKLYAKRGSAMELKDEILSLNVAQAKISKPAAPKEPPAEKQLEKPSTPTTSKKQDALSGV